MSSLSRLVDPELASRIVAHHYGTLKFVPDGWSKVELLLLYHDMMVCLRKT
jgi:hypothetical protein